MKYLISSLLIVIGFSLSACGGGSSSGETISKAEGLESPVVSASEELVPPPTPMLQEGQPRIVNNKSY